MHYVDSISDISNQNTLWALGNHDYSDLNRAQKFTGRPLFYLERYYIGFKLMDSGYPQYAWLKMHGAKFMEHAFDDIYSSTTQIINEELFRVFPNPASKQIQIHSSYNNTTSLSISE